MVDRLMSRYGASERHACRVLCVTRGTYRYRSCLDPRTELRMRIREIAQTRYGYRKIRVRLNREGWDVGKYLVYRLCKEEGLMLKRMKPAGKRKAARLREEKVIQLCAGLKALKSLRSPQWVRETLSEIVAAAHRISVKNRPSEEGQTVKAVTLVLDALLRLLHL
jgi:hypothetical protein